MQLTQLISSITPTFKSNNFFGFQNSAHLWKNPTTQQKHARIQAHIKDLQTKSQNLYKHSKGKLENT